MVSSFDIFKIDPIGNVSWRDSAENLAAAEKRVATLSTVVPGEYLIFNQQTQERFAVGIAAVELLPITRQLATTAEAAHLAEQLATPAALSQD